MVTLIVGTLAFDEIAATRDPLGGEHVRVTNWHTRFGGCGGNVSWNLARLGFAHRLSGYLGGLDGAPYLDHLWAAGADTSAIQLVSGMYSARAFIVTDAEGRQFTAFMPLEIRRERYLADLEAAIDGSRPSFALITPDHPAHMLDAVRRLRGVCPLASYPGQYTSHLVDEMAAELFDACDVIFQNATEHGRFPLTPAAPSGAGRPDLRPLLRPRPGQLVIVTRGADPVRLITHETVTEIPVPPVPMVDPTGCGDAFTAAFIAAWRSGATPPEAVRTAIAWAGRCVAVHGSQCH